MGGKQNRRRKCFYLFFTLSLIIIPLLSGCVRFYEELITQADFEQAVALTNEDKFRQAEVKYEQIISRHSSVGDEVLFQMGIIYASPRNQNKNYQKSLDYFQRLINNYPQSRYIKHAGVFSFLLQEIMNRDKTTNTQRKQVEKLEQQLAELEKKLEQIKEVDLNWKQKKKKFP